jgi:hypothetical protein
LFLCLSPTTLEQPRPDGRFLVRPKRTPANSIHPGHRIAVQKCREFVHVVRQPVRFLRHENKPALDRSGLGMRAHDLGSPTADLLFSSAQMGRRSIGSRNRRLSVRCDGRCGCCRMVGEAVATFGLRTPIIAGIRFQQAAVPRLLGPMSRWPIGSRHRLRLPIRQVASHWVLAVARSSTNTFSASKVPAELTQSG